MSNPSDPTDPHAWPSYGDGPTAGAPEDETLPLGMPSLPTRTTPLVPPSEVPAPTAGLVAPTAPSIPPPAQQPAPASYSAPAPPAYAGYGIPQQYLAGGNATNGVAVTALVMGIVGLVSLALVPVIGISIIGAICSPLAIGFGLWGRSQIDKQPGVYGNRALATTGFWLGVIGTVLAVLAILLVVAFVGFLVWIFGTSA